MANMQTGEQFRRSQLGAAVAAHRAGRLDEARLIYARILRRDRGDPDVLNFLGMLEFQAGERQRGIDLLRKSLNGAPRNAHTLLNLGNMLAAVEGPEAALAMYERALAFDPRFTCEALPENDGDSFRLLPHGRYAHCGSYVRRILESTPFEVIAVEPVILRRERGVDVAGRLATARRHT